MIIQVDTREKARAIEPILNYLNNNKQQYIINKLYAGDYVALENPFVIIDRKQNIRELATNATKEHERFKRELQRVQEIGAEMVILVQEDKIDGKKIESLEDVMLWTPKKGQGTVSGMRVYKILAYWSKVYPVRFEFIPKRDTGKRIIEILGSGLKTNE